MNRENLWDTYEVMQKKPNKKNEMEFFSQLSQARVYLPISDKKDSIILIKKNDQKYIPLFTTMAEALEFNPKTQEFKNILIEDMKSLLFNENHELDVSGIVLNPLEKNLIVEKSVLVKMFKATEKIVFDSSRNYFSGLHLIVPNSTPKNLQSNITKFVSKDLDFLIIQINLYKARRDLDDPMHWLMLAKFLGNKQLMLPILSNLIKETLRPTEFFEIYDYDDDINFLYTKNETAIYKML